MKYLAQLALFASTSFNLFRSLKYLKRISQHDITDGIEHDKAISVLMFWVIYALLAVFEEYLEWLLRWFPGYFYGKAFFITLISIPALRITHLVFNDGVVVLFHSMNGLRQKLDLLPPWRVILANAPFWILIVLFPPLGMLDDDNDTSSSSRSSSSSKRNDPLLSVVKEDENQNHNPVFCDDDTTQSVVLPQLRRRFVPNNTDTESRHFSASQPLIPLTTSPPSINRPANIITNLTAVIPPPPDSAFLSNLSMEGTSPTSPTTPVKKSEEKEVVSSSRLSHPTLLYTLLTCMIHPSTPLTSTTHPCTGSIAVA